MAIKRIFITDKSKEPPVELGVMTFDKDSNGRLRVRDGLPKNISQEAVDTVCSDMYIGMKNGNIGPFTWSE